MDNTEIMEMDDASSTSLDSDLSDHDERAQELADLYGQTPPRTRINRKQIKKQRILSEAKSLSASDMRKKSICRRNTVDTIIVSNLYDQEDKDRQQEMEDAAAREGSRQDKHTLKMNRGRDRDFKLDIEAATQHAKNQESRLASSINKIQIGIRFNSLCSKPVDICKKKADENIKKLAIISPLNINDDESNFLNDRKTFHSTFSQLINLGSKDKDKDKLFELKKDQEQTRYQNEIKDLIWLELKAYHADRSLVAQDEYLCKQRESIGVLLTEIMDYKYDLSSSLTPPLGGSTSSLSSSPVPSFSSTVSSSNDSGYGGSASILLEQTCPGCLSMYCSACSRSQLTAMRQVESLLRRLEAAEALYPTSQAFGTHYELYKSPEFTDRVKTMCLWLNITRHHRFKLRILGRLLTLVASGKTYPEIVSAMSTMSSDAKESTSSSNECVRQSQVRFDLSGCDSPTTTTTTPTDSEQSSSNVSSSGFIYPRPSLPSTPETMLSLDDTKSDRFFRDSSFKEFDRQSYRLYIEEVLKTRGLSKSLQFLDRLHNAVLKKTSLTFKICPEEERNKAPEDSSLLPDWELKRYGVWSSEAQALNLPSYKSSFIFLSRVPLDVLNEFMWLRLEQKPAKPEPLSVRQLMKEMKEGIQIACMHRDRFVEHSKTIMSLDESSYSLLNFDDVREFDDNLQSVFKVYLDYLGQWIEMVLYNNLCQKSINAEWEFVKSIAGRINNGYIIFGIKFCSILGTLIHEVNEFLVNRPQEILENAADIEEDDPDIRFMYLSLGREWQSMFVQSGSRLNRILCLSISLIDAIKPWLDESNDLAIALEELKTTLLTPSIKMKNLIIKFCEIVDKTADPQPDADRNAKRTRIREIFNQAFKMGFNYYEKICKLFHEDERHIFVNNLIHFSKLWMDFVQTRCDRGRGIRPGWASNGFEFLSLACHPSHTKHLSDDEFEELKASMDRCITHVIGDNRNGSVTTGTFTEQEGLRRLSRSPGPSPAQSRSATPSLRSRDSFKSPDVFNIPRKSSSSFSVVDSSSSSLNLTMPDSNQIKRERILSAIKNLDTKIDDFKRSHRLIGHSIDKRNVDRIKIRIKEITFTWQRGIKIGQGSFGKVYTVVNNQSGELLAMKEIPLQPGDCRAVRNVVEELKIVEGIQDKHLVRYYGIEIHREEMLIFMEFCAEGTLESIVQASDNGLPEIFVRKYTHQLVSAVSVLHEHGIVHHDIKCANIFLTDEGNCLKLGDFGSAVQIKAHMTMTGEIKEYNGTQAYMAPEVFMKSESGGHGRAADIWSLACCVIEMASGKRPWIECDASFQIMYKVGMGECPNIPDSLCQDGVDFVEKCLQHDPKKRPTSNSLLSHIFIRNCDDINIDLLTQCVAPLNP